MIVYSRLLVLLLLITLVSGCASGPPPAATSEAPGATPVPANPGDPTPFAAEQTPIVITFASYEYERARYEPVMAAFNTENPDIRVQFVSLDALMASEGSQPLSYDAWMRQIASAADTFPLFSTSSDLISKGYIRDLAPLIDADPAFAREDFVQGALQAAQDGTIASIPDTLRIPLLTYNKDLWDARGVATPAPDWTWDDLLQAATQLADKSGDQIRVYGLLDRDGGTSVLERELLNEGLDLSVAQEEPLQLDDQRIIAAMERVEALFEAGILFFPPRYPDGSFLHSNDYIPLIRDQRIGIWGAGMESAGPSETLPFATGIAPYPVDARGKSALNNSGFALSGGSLSPEAAWRWLSFLSRNGPPPESYGDPGVIPARRSIAERNGIWDAIEPETRSAIEAVLAQPVGDTFAERISARTRQPAFWNNLDNALNEVVGGTKDAAEALSDAQVAMEQQLAEQAGQPTATPDPRPIVVATPVPERVAAPGATQIRFGTIGFGPGDPRTIADSFNEQNTDLFVTVENIDFSSGPSNLADITAQYDCISWWGAPTTEELTATLDLQPLIDADPAFPRDDYAAGVLAPFLHDGKLSGLPLSLSFRMLAYNKEAFDAAGLDYPSEGWTLDDFMHIAQQLNSGSGENQRYGFAGADPTSLSFFLTNMGVSPIRPSGEAYLPDFTNPALIQAIESYLGFLQNASPHTRFGGYTRDGADDDAYMRIGNGEVGMWFTYDTAGFHGPTEPAFTTGLAPLPLGDDSLSTEDLFVRGLVISAQTQHPEACWRWIKHLSEQPALSESDFPVRISQLKTLGEDLISPKADVARAYSIVLERGAANEQPSWYVSELDFFWFFRAIDRAIQGKSLESELADAQLLTEQYQACIQGGEQPGTCATQVDPDYQGWNQP